MLLLSFGRECGSGRVVLLILWAESQNYYQVRRMKINSKIDEPETISDSKLLLQTPKSAHISIKRTTWSKKLSLIDPLETPKLWKESSSSLSRERSPSHKIPNSSRFPPGRDEDMKNMQFLTLQLRTDIASKHSIRFAQSKRPEHFIRTEKINTPSPATYNCSRFLEDNNSAVFERTVEHNPELSSTSRSNKGISIPGFNSYHKSYIDHSKHNPYQPQSTSQNPGPGHYNLGWANKRKKESYSMRVALRKFNQTTNSIPGPGTYTPYRSQRLSSINMKGTLPLSNRIYLTKFQHLPCPQTYRPEETRLKFFSHK